MLQANCPHLVEGHCLACVQRMVRSMTAMAGSVSAELSAARRALELAGVTRTTTHLAERLRPLNPRYADRLQELEVEKAELEDRLRRRDHGCC